MPNTFPARERRFITDLAAELHLDVSWDGYDDEDQNLVVFRLPGASQNGGSKATNGTKGSTPPEVEQDGDDDNEDWVDESDESEEEPEALEAVDRVLKKYERAKVADEEEDDFDIRHERALQERMDEWKRGYYRVRFS